MIRCETGKQWADGLFFSKNQNELCFSLYLVINFVDSESPLRLFILHNETNPAKYSFLNFFFKHSLLDSCLWRSKWIAIHLYSLGVERWLVQWYSCFLLTEHTCVLKSMEKCRWIIHKKFWMKWFLKRKGFEFHLKKKSTYFFRVTAKLF